MTFFLSSSPTMASFKSSGSRQSFFRNLPVRIIFSLIPAILWLLLFTFGVALIPPHSRPTINVDLLPRLDHFIFSNSWNWFTTNPPYAILDLLAAIPYTIHPILPFLFIISSLPSSSRRSCLLRFMFAFGFMNLSAVITHLIFPTAPPWYYIKYRFKPADYSMKGDPAILARVDNRLNISMFHNMYSKGGKVVFGAWPSLHAAWPYLMARFKPTFDRRVQPFLWAYTLLVWWAAIYLQHHFAADVVGGILYAEIANKVALYIYGYREFSKKDYLPVTVTE